MSVDWDHPEWVGGFFPDDLPDDWRLTYYANEFRGVLVPEHRWRERRPQLLEEWVDEVDERFRFYLQLDRPELLAASDKAFAALGQSLGGVVLPPGADPASVEGLPLFQVAEPGVSPASRLPRAWIVQSMAASDLMTQRRLLELIVSESPPSTEIPLFVQGNPPSTELMQNLRQLAQLMGYS
jgi:hypothetical protein